MKKKKEKPTGIILTIIFLSLVVIGCTYALILGFNIHKSQKDVREGLQQYIEISQNVIFEKQSYCRDWCKKQGWNYYKLDTTANGCMCFDGNYSLRVVR